MSKIRTIIRHELVSLYSHKSYLVILFLVPLIGFAFYFGALAISRGIAPEGVGDLFSAGEAPGPQAYVDQSGLFGKVPDSLDGLMLPVKNEAEARALIQTGKAEAYYVIHSDYIASGRVDFIQKNYNFLATQSEAANLRTLITFNLFAEQDRAKRYLEPLNINTVYLRDLVEKDFGGAQNFWLPYSVMMLFYLLIIGSSSMMLNSITSEKKNRVIEVLLTSATPQDLLVGKTIALGAAGLLQTLLWLGSSFILLTLAGRQLSLPAVYNLPPELFGFGLAFFLFGYALYSSLMAGLGALVPNPKEGSQATLVVIFPLIIPLFFSSLVATAPNNPLFVFFSLFPLTSPISMVSRMSATAVPGWQIWLSLVLLALSGVVTIRIAARMFRAQELLSGKPFRASEYFKALIARS